MSLALGLESVYATQGRYEKGRNDDGCLLWRLDQSEALKPGQDQSQDFRSLGLEIVCMQAATQSRHEKGQKDDH